MTSEKITAADIVGRVLAIREIAKENGAAWNGYPLEWLAVTSGNGYYSTHIRVPNDGSIRQMSFKNNRETYAYLGGILDMCRFNTITKG